MEGADALAEISPGVVVDVAVDLAFDAVKFYGVFSVVSIVVSACFFNERDKDDEGSGDECGGDFRAHGSISMSSAVFPAATHSRYSSQGRPQSATITPPSSHTRPS